VTETNVFELTQLGTFSDPLAEVLRNGARTLFTKSSGIFSGAESTLRLIVQGVAFIPEANLFVTPCTINQPRARRLQNRKPQSRSKPWHEAIGPSPLHQTSGMQTHGC
jgi:hypothetical protein